MSGPVVSLLAAVARNGVIGAGRSLPWRISSDLKHFKALSLGKPLIMGRKTFESIGEPLPGRETIVVTRDRAWSHEGVAIAHSAEEALEIARKTGATEIIVAGGGEIFAATIGIADLLHITEVDLAPEGDARFPAIDKARWREVSRQPGLRGPRDEAQFTFVEYERRL